MPKTFQCIKCKRVMLTGTYGLIRHVEKCNGNNSKFVNSVYPSGGSECASVAVTVNSGIPELSNAIEDGPIYGDE